MVDELDALKKIEVQGIFLENKTPLQDTVIVDNDMDLSKSIELHNTQQTLMYAKLKKKIYSGSGGSQDGTHNVRKQSNCIMDI